MISSTISIQISNDNLQYWVLKDANSSNWKALESEPTTLQEICQLHQGPRYQSCILNLWLRSIHTACDRILGKVKGKVHVCPGFTANICGQWRRIQGLKEFWLSLHLIDVGFHAQIHTPGTGGLSDVQLLFSISTEALEAVLPFCLLAITSPKNIV